MIVWSASETIAIEVETRADHPEQVRRNYEKNRWASRIIFMVPNQEVGLMIKRILGEEAEVYVLEV